MLDVSHQGWAVRKYVSSTNRKSANFFCRLSGPSANVTSGTDLRNQSLFRFAICGFEDFQTQFLADLQIPQICKYCALFLSL